MYAGMINKEVKTVKNMVKEEEQMPRRGENIYKRKDGRWEGRIPNGYGEKGDRKQKSVYGKSYKEVKDKMKLAVTEVPKVSRKLLMQEAIGLWLSANRMSWKESTYATYAQLAACQIYPDIGRTPIIEFDSIAFNNFIIQKRQTKKTNSADYLSETYVSGISCMIAQTFRYLCQEYHYELVIPNVPQKYEADKKHKFPEEQELCILERYLIEHIADSTNLGILLCYYTGIRIGELCALQWKDIDFREGILKISKTMQRVKNHNVEPRNTKILITTPKTKKSMREIPIPKVVLPLLEQYQKGRDDYVIAGKKSCYVEPRVLQYRFKNILIQCGIPVFNFHMLRHIFATKCIIAGFDVNSLSELLGHSSIQVTLRLYVHSSLHRKKTLMECLKLTAA